MNDITIARVKKSDAVLICRKCLKRIAKGKTLPRALKGEMRALAPDGAKKTRIVMSSCFGVCPKRAVVTTNGAHLARGEYLLLDARSVGKAAAALCQTNASALSQSELRTAE